MIAFLHRRSPEKGAEALWDQETVNKDDLPNLRASSDLAYAMWHRETTEQNRENIQRFIAIGITNKETWVMISRALDLEDPEDWLGTPTYADRRKFVFFHPDHEDAAEETEAAYALLGKSAHAH